MSSPSYSYWFNKHLGGGLGQTEGQQKRNSVTRPSYLGQRNVASIRNNNPGAMWPGPSSRKFGARSSQKLNDGLGQGNKAATFPDAVSGASALFDLLNRRYTGMSVKDAVSKWSGGNNVNSYLNVLAKRGNINPNRMITPELLRDPQWALRFGRSMAFHEAGKPYPLSPEQWRLAHSEAFGLKQKSEPQIVYGKEGMYSDYNRTTQSSEATIPYRAPDGDVYPYGDGGSYNPQPQPPQQQTAVASYHQQRQRNTATSPLPSPNPQRPTGATWVTGSDGMNPLFASDATPQQLKEYFPQGGSAPKFGSMFKGLFK